MSREGTVPQATKQQHKPRSRTMRPPSVYFGLYLYPTKGLRKIWYILQAMSLIRNHTENLLDYVSSNLPHPNPSRFWKLLSLHSPPWCLVAMFVRYESSPVTVNGPRLGPIVTGSGCANRNISQEEGMKWREIQSSPGGQTSLLVIFSKVCPGKQREPRYKKREERRPFKTRDRRFRFFMAVSLRFQFILRFTACLPLGFGKHC